MIGWSARDFCALEIAATHPPSWIADLAGEGLPVVKFTSERMAPSTVPPVLRESGDGAPPARCNQNLWILERGPRRTFLVEQLETVGVEAPARKEGTPVLRVVAEETAAEEVALGIDEIGRQGAQRMLAVALEAEVNAYVAEHQQQRDERGRRLVVRNGHAEPRVVKTAAGAVRVEAPRVNDRRIEEESGERPRFRSSILLPWCRRSPQVSAVLPLL
jgi:hypothetical protein